MSAAFSLAERLRHFFRARNLRENFLRPILDSTDGGVGQSAITTPLRAGRVSTQIYFCLYPLYNKYTSSGSQRRVVISPPCLSLGVLQCFAIQLLPFALSPAFFSHPSLSYRQLGCYAQSSALNRQKTLHCWRHWLLLALVAGHCRGCFLS